MRENQFKTKLEKTGKKWNFIHFEIVCHRQLIQIHR